MADLEDVTLDGRPLQSLRVADLKAALEERGLSKSGQKNALIKRLKGALMLENLQRTSTNHFGLQPNSQIGEEMSQNSFIKQYLAKQQELLRQRLEREAREAYETNEQEDHAEVNNSTSCPPAQDAATVMADQHKPPGPSGGEGFFGAVNEAQANRNQEADMSAAPASGSMALRVPSAEHRPERGSASSDVAGDSDDDDSEDGEEDGDDDDWDNGARRRNLREPARVPAVRERSGVSCQPQQQHIPSLLSPQLRQPTPPPSPPPELSFPLPDTPKQSPPSPDAAPGRRSPSSSSSGSSSSGSRSSSPEPQRSGHAERKPGPLTLLARKMASEGAFSGAGWHGADGECDRQDGSSPSATTFPGRGTSEGLVSAITHTANAAGHAPFPMIPGTNQGAPGAHSAHIQVPVSVLKAAAVEGRDRAKEAELERERAAESERQEKLRKLQEERERIERQQALERHEKEKALQRERELALERERQEREQALARERALELERQKELERQRAMEQERLQREKERHEREEMERALEKQRLEKERALEAERKEKERIAREKALEQERLERERIEREKALEQERLERERVEREKALEKERIEREKALERERIEREKALEKERIEREKALEKERLERERALEQERLERERIEREKALEKERLERERALEQERLERERIEREKALEKERLERERIERERALEQERLERVRIEREKALEQDRLERERIEREKALEKERIERERIERAIALEQERLERERVEREKALEQERIKRERALEDERLAKEKALVQERIEKQRALEEEKAKEQERIEKEKALEQKRLEREKVLEQERLEKKRGLEQERIEREKAMQREREEKERIEREREKALAQERLEKEKVLQREKAEQEKDKAKMAEKERESHLPPSKRGREVGLTPLPTPPLSTGPATKSSTEAGEQEDVGASVSRSEAQAAEPGTLLSPTPLSPQSSFKKFRFFRDPPPQSQSSSTSMVIKRPRMFTDSPQPRVSPVSSPTRDVERQREGQRPPAEKQEPLVATNQEVAAGPPGSADLSLKGSTEGHAKEGAFRVRPEEKDQAASAKTERAAMESTEKARAVNETTCSPERRGRDLKKVEKQRRQRSSSDSSSSESDSGSSSSRSSDSSSSSQGKARPTSRGRRDGKPERVSSPLRRVTDDAQGFKETPEASSHKKEKSVEKRSTTDKEDCHTKKSFLETPTRVETHRKREDSEGDEENDKQREMETAMADPDKLPETSDETPKAFSARKISLSSSKSSPGSGSAEAEQDAGTAAGRKRRWGSSTAVTAKKPSISITTDSLKSLIPDIKPCLGQDAVVDLHPEEAVLSGTEEEREHSNQDLQIRRTVTQVVHLENQENGQKESKRSRLEELEEEDVQVVQERIKAHEDPLDTSIPVAMEGQSPTLTSHDVEMNTVTPGDTLIRRSISQQKTGVSVTIDDPVRTARQPSPPRGKVSTIVHVCNLVRPFTLGQLKELLSRTGTLVEDGFWIDKIKSHCFVTYSTSEEAIATRAALHGVKWPQSNPKLLSVDFCQQDELDFHKGLGIANRPVAEDQGPGLARGRTSGLPSLLPERDQWAEREREMERRERARAEREWDRDKVREFEKPGEDKVGGPRRSRSRERRRKERGKSKEKKADKKDKAAEDPPAKLLDDLFRKTKAAPCIYWLPLSEEQFIQREAARAERKTEREKRRKEQEEEEKREEERKERVKAAGGATGDRSEGEKDKDRDRERDRGRDRDRERDRERENDKRRDGYRRPGGSGAGGGRRSRSRSEPRERRR